MKISKTASNIEIKMSQKEWLEIGNKAGWIKVAQEDPQENLRRKMKQREDRKSAMEQAYRILKSQNILGPEFAEFYAQKETRMPGFNETPLPPGA